MISLIKMNIKLLVRNKGFLFFLLVTPMLSTLILSIKIEQTYGNEYTEVSKVIELTDYTQKAVYLGDTSQYIVKVYDASRTDLSEYVLETLSQKGLFSVCRCDVSDMTEQEVESQAKKDAYDDRAGVLWYLKEEFDTAVFDGDLEAGMQMYVVSEDDRQELFETELVNLLENVKQVQTVVGEDSDAIIEMLDAIMNQVPEKRVVSLAGKDDIELSRKQSDQRARIGYAFAIITLGFLFCGVCVAHTVIEEQNNKVFTRVMLSKVGRREYFLSKYVVTLMISVMQTLVLGGCLLAMKGLDFGIHKGSFLIAIFLLGIIFSTLSLLLGVLMGEVMSSNYAMFAVWSISALLAGLYFPLDDTTSAIKTLSFLMPQRWFMNASELLLVGDKGAYSMLLCVTVAYLIVIISVGCVGLKMKRSEA